MLALGPLSVPKMKLVLHPLQMDPAGCVSSTLVKYSLLILTSLFHSSWDTWGPFSHHILGTYCAPPNALASLISFTSKYLILVITQITMCRRVYLPSQALLTYKKTRLRGLPWWKRKYGSLSALNRGASTFQLTHVLFIKVYFNNASHITL